MPLRVTLVIATLVEALGGRPRPRRRHVDEVDEEVVAQRAGAVREHAVSRPACVGVEGPHAAHEDRHLGDRQVQEGRLLHQHLCRRPGGAAAEVVAEPVRGRLEQGEGVDVGLVLRGVRAAGREGHVHVDAGLLRRPLDGGGAAEDDEVGQRDPLAARLRVVEVAADALQGLQHAAQLGRVVGGPVVLRREAMRPSLAPPRMSVPRNVDAEAQAALTSSRGSPAAGARGQGAGEKIRCGDDRSPLQRGGSPEERTGSEPVLRRSSPTGWGGFQ